MRPIEKTSLSDILMKKIQTEDSFPFLFLPGQMCRVLSNISEDGQTPIYWDGAKVLILYRSSSLLNKEHIYRVKHLGNGKECDFKECELDKRFIRKQWKI